jgi:hypothetical protein
MFQECGPVNLIKHWCQMCRAADSAGTPIMYETGTPSPTLHGHDALIFDFNINYICFLSFLEHLVISIRKCKTVLLYICMQMYLFWIIGVRDLK